MIKAAVFDLDHTLYDRYETIKKVMPFFMSHFDMALPLDKATEMMIYADKAFVHFGWERVHSYLAENGFFKTVPPFEDYREGLLESFRSDAVEYPFTKPMLDTLHQMGIKTGLITNGMSVTQRKKLQMLGLENYLDEIIISGELGFSKPSPEPFTEMAKRLGIAPGEMIYVGDNPYADILGARNGGCIPVWVKTTGLWVLTDIEMAEYSVENVGEIPMLIKERLS